MNSHYPWPEYMAYSHPMANLSRFPEQTFYHATPQHYPNERNSISAIAFNNSRAAVSSNNQRSAVSSNNPRSANIPKAAVSSNNTSSRKARRIRSKRYANNCDEGIRNRYHPYSHQGINQRYSFEAPVAQVAPDFGCPCCGINRSSVTNQHLKNIEQIYASTSFTRSQDPVNLVKREHSVETEPENSSLANNCKAENFLGSISSAPILGGLICNFQNEKFEPTYNKNTITRTSYSENPEIQLTQKVIDTRLDVVVDRNLNSSTVSTDMENKINQIGALINANASLLNGHEIIDFEGFIDNADDSTSKNNDVLVTNYEANDQPIDDPNADQLVDELIRIACELEQSSKNGESENLLTTSKQQNMMLSHNKIAGLEEQDILEDSFLSILDSEKLDALLATCVEPISVLKGETSCENFSFEDKNAQIKTYDLNTISISTHNSKAQQTEFPVCVDAQTQVTAIDFEKVCEQVVTRYYVSQQGEISMVASDSGNVEDLLCEKDDGPKEWPKRDSTHSALMGVKQSKDHIQTKSSSSIESEFGEVDTSENNDELKGRSKRGLHSALGFEQSKGRIQTTSSSSIESECEDLQCNKDDGMKGRPRRGPHSALGFKQSNGHIQTASSSSIESEFSQIDASKNYRQLTTDKYLTETPRALRKRKEINKNYFSSKREAKSKKK